MSTFIVKSISINKKTNQVFLTGYNSNEYPKTPKRFESTYLTDMLTAQGQDVLDTYLLEQYQDGMLRGGNNDYANVLALGLDMNLENLKTVRGIKSENKGQRFIVKVSNGSFYKKGTKRNYYSTYSKEHARHFDKIGAMVIAKRINGEIIQF